ncbi:MAG: hypothetical protein A2W35_10035 [Chloroflexi bacterium RBG_16_57_11]|nr:MAG: hypothetical protein A2W35_10035 [Chloroflexi bacterium RBG_16_57_11]
MDKMLTSVVIDGVTLNMVAELVYDLQENRDVRVKWSNVHLRALEDLCFALYWAGMITLDKNMWVSPTNRAFIELLQKTSNNTAIQYLEIPKLEDVVKNDSEVRYGIMEQLPVLDRAVRDQPQYWKQFTQSDYIKFGKIKEGSPHAKDLSFVKFNKDYLTNPDLLERIPNEAVEFGIRSIKESRPADDVSYNILAEFVRRLYVTHISIGWNYFKQSASKNADYMSAPTRVSVWLSASESKLQEYQSRIRKLFLPYFLDRFLVCFPDQPTQPIEFADILVDFCLNPKPIDREAQKLFRELMHITSPKKLKKEFDNIYTRIVRISSGEQRDQIGFGLSGQLISGQIQGEPPMWVEKLNYRWWLRYFFRHDNSLVWSRINFKLNKIFPGTFEG